MSHPSAIDLEAFSAGEPAPSVGAHVEGCDACRAFVERARGLSPRRSIAPLLASARRRERGRRAFFAASVAAPLAMAAAAILLIRSPSLSAPPANPAATHVLLAPFSPSADPDTTFKGGLQLAVVRERDGAQKRFTDAVAVKPGDRLRIEVAIDRPQAILGAVVGDDGSYVELMVEGVRDTGTHLSEKSVRIDPRPMNGTIVVGAPDAVHRARDSRSFDGVRTLHVTWEGGR